MSAAVIISIQHLSFKVGLCGLRLFILPISCYCHRHLSISYERSSPFYYTPIILSHIRPDDASLCVSHSLHTTVLRPARALDPQLRWSIEGLGFLCEYEAGSENSPKASRAERTARFDGAHKVTQQVSDLEER
jgi:hypothetical protein